VLVCLLVLLLLLLSFPVRLYEAKIAAIEGVVAVAALAVDLPLSQGVQEVSSILPD
jgi:hypothetical protein